MLLKNDYLQFLDFGMKARKTYKICNPASSRGQPSTFAINLAEIAAITTTLPAE